MSLPSPADKRRRFRSRLAGTGLISAPGVYDMVSARLADSLGFEALYMTGYGVVASHLGLPDAGIATYSDMAGRVTRMAGGTATPIIADGDTGYGGLLNVQHTVRGYEAAGAVGIQLEDQEFPKKCGHMLGRRVVPVEDMVRKIEVAAASRDSSEFVIVARTDARTTHGLDEALRRGDAFVRAGADVVFIESPESPEEMRRIGDTFRGIPLVANMVEGGRTPVLPAADLEAIGYRLAIFPVLGLLAAAEAMSRAYRHLRDSGSSAGGNVPLHDFQAFGALMGFDEIAAFDRRWRD